MDISLDQLRSSYASRTTEELLVSSAQGGLRQEAEMNRRLEDTPREARRDPLVDNPALAEEVRIGWITPAEIVSDEPPPRLPVAPLRELLQELGESRADR